MSIQKGQTEISNRYVILSISFETLKISLASSRILLRVFSVSVFGLDRSVLFMDLNLSERALFGKLFPSL